MPRGRIDIGGQHIGLRLIDLRPAALRQEGPQQLQPINAAQHQIHHQDVGPTAAHQFQCLLAVAHRANDFHIGFSVDHVCQQDAEFFVRVRK